MRYLVESHSEYLKQVLYLCTICEESFIVFQGKTYNGECISRRGVDGSNIWMKYRDYYTYNSTHIEDCSNYCKQTVSSGDYTTWYPLQTTGYPRPTRYPNTEMVTGTNSWRTTWDPYPDWPYARSDGKEKESFKETEDLPEVQANGQQEFQYFGWENYDRSKFHLSEYPMRTN